MESFLCCVCSKALDFFNQNEMNRKKPGKSGQIRTNTDKYGQIRTNTDKYGQIVMNTSLNKSSMAKKRILRRKNGNRESFEVALKKKEQKSEMYSMV